MNKRALFLGALVLAIAGFITHCVAQSFLEAAMDRKSERISQSAKQHTPYVADPLAVQASLAWKVLTATGVVLTVLSVACMGTAALRHEPGSYLLLVLLLVLDIVMPMLL